MTQISVRPRIFEYANIFYFYSLNCLTLDVTSLDEGFCMRSILNLNPPPPPVVTMRLKANRNHPHPTVL